MIQSVNNSAPTLEQLLDFAVQLAREAGDVTLRYFQQSYALDRKADKSFVTTADREAEALLRRRILEKFPHDSILGEEEGERAGTSNRRWIIDPIDGTYSFVHGVPLYGVLIGLEVEDEPSIGVVNMPALGDIVWAARGHGCFWNNNRARVSTTSSLEEALLLCTDFGACAKYGFGDAITKLQQRAQTRRTWSDCYGYVLVANVLADGILDPAMNV